MKRYILGFGEITRGDISSAGGKGANLGEMTRAGIVVPPGAVLTAQAYDRFISENGISDSGAAADIRKAVRAGTIPADIADEIVGAYRSLGENARVAVRSSATAEDLADASFAGQQETYLNVTGEAELLEKIKDCYASLWGDRAVSYRRTQGYDRQKVSLAVVIQQMIESEYAGVIFTKDPSGTTGDIVINASYGLGEAVVSGLVSPDEYRCGRDGEIKTAFIGSKEIQIVYGDKGTVKEPVSEEKRSRRVLDDGQIKRLAEAALAVEKHYGQPMDIEWAIRDGVIYILQARSITTLGNSAPLFTDEDFARLGLPKVKPAKGKMRENVLFNLEKLPKPYLPLDHDFGDNVGRQKEILIAEAGFHMNEMTPIDGDGISSFGIGGFKPTGNIRHLPQMLRQMKDTSRNISSADNALRECRKRLADETSTTHGSVRELGQALERMKKLIGDTAHARFRYAIFPQVLENISLERKLKKLDRSLSSFDLMEGLSYVTADINREMSVIAEMIRSDEKLLAAVTALPYSELIAEFPELTEIFAGFMDKYGCRTDLNCYCFTSKSWNDDPDRFLAALRTLIRNDSFRVPPKQESMDKFKALMQKMQMMLGRKRYPGFKKKVMAVRHYHYIREATQYLWECEFALCRRLLGQCADMLGTGYDDLLYLFADELFAVCRSGAVNEKYRSLIEKRKARRPLAEAYWSRSIELALASDSKGITGVSGSPGNAAGKVRIIRSPAEFDRLQQGEVLVCTYTDPEWTPLFTLAAAVVVDSGGTLSHAAIVAREYKIPCVLATGNATKLLKDGDMVIVDGTDGRVTVTGSE